MYTLSLADVINPSKLLKFCDEELSSLTIEDIETLHKKLNHKKKNLNTSSMEQPDLLFQVLYTWHSKNPLATRKQLALQLQEAGMYKQAIQLDSSCKCVIIIQ